MKRNSQSSVKEDVEGESKAKTLCAGLRLSAYPMHGQSKLVHESHFSKDGHFIDGLGGTLDGGTGPRPRGTTVCLVAVMARSEGLSVGTRPPW